MVPELRQPFNAQWTEARYRDMMRALEAHVGCHIEFPISETPCFFRRSLLDRLAEVGRELIAQAMDPRALEATSALTPERFRGPGEGASPIFVQVDFGLVRASDGSVEPRLVELQAFASLYAFQLALSEHYLQTFELAMPVGLFLGGIDRGRYLSELRTAIVGPHEADHVVLMEIEPHRQKTRPDFLMTEQLWGVRALDTREIQREGRELWYRREGRRVPIRRIYNRIVPDELERSRVRMPFDYRDDLNVEWAGHPAWYFLISKASIPRLRHRSVPRTWSLDEIDLTDLPLDREQVLLKPLFSFAGGGIVFAPSDADLAAIPPARRREFILQERIAFTPVIETPHGPTQAELRLMYVWTDDVRPMLALVRMGRGKMMGVDHNKGLRWVGASTAFSA
ncbi:MAG: hypothetical protein ABR606_04400 [Vicinamibacterales bacterium]